MFNRKTRDLSTNQMISLENQLYDSTLGQLGHTEPEDKLIERFGLQKIIDDTLAKDEEAALDEPLSEQYKGVIRVKSKYSDNSFSCLHEIMHYVFDVGPGNTVKKRYSRKIKGSTKDMREQEINYLAASYKLPYSEIHQKIQEFENTYPRDELRFVAKLCKEYSQPRETVMRRIREVKRLSESKQIINGKK